MILNLNLRIKTAENVHSASWKLEDNFNVDFIRWTIKNYHLKYHHLPILLKLKGIFQEKLYCGGSISTVRTVLLKLGYKWRRTGYQTCYYRVAWLSKAMILLHKKFIQIPSRKSVCYIYRWELYLNQLCAKERIGL